MITLYSDKDLSTLAPGTNLSVREMYIDTDVFYKMFYIFHEMGLTDYFTFDVDRNGNGVYVRITSADCRRIEKI